MEKTATLNLRVNPVVKERAEEVLSRLGICLWQLKNRSLGSLKIQSVYWGLGV